MSECIYVRACVRARVPWLFKDQRVFERGYRKAPCATQEVFMIIIILRELSVNLLALCTGGVAVTQAKSNNSRS